MNLTWLADGWWHWNQILFMQGIIPFAVYVLLWKAVQKLPCRWGYWIALLVLIKFVVPFPVTISLPVPVKAEMAAKPYQPQMDVYKPLPAKIQNIPIKREGKDYIANDTKIVPRGTNAASDTKNTVYWRWSYKEYLLAVWCIGMAIFFSLVIHGIIVVRKVLCSTELHQENDFYTGKLALKAGLKKLPAVRLSTVPHSPFVYGFWRPVIVVPQALAQLETDDFEMLLLHEMAHIRRHDHQMAWLLNGVFIFFWWNPFVWFLLRWIRNEMEHCCDEWVLEMNPAEEKRYGRLLLDIAESAIFDQQFFRSPAFSESQSALKNRIQRIVMYHQNQKVNKISVFCMIVVSGILLMPVWSVEKYAVEEKSETYTLWKYQCEQAQRFSATFTGELKYFSGDRLRKYTYNHLFEYTYTKKDNNTIQKILESQEYILKYPSMIQFNHDRSRMSVMSRDSARDTWYSFYQCGFNPEYFLYPMALIPDINKASIKEDGAYYIVQWQNADPMGIYRQVQTKIDKENKTAVQTIIQTSNEQYPVPADSNTVWITELLDFSKVNGEQNVFPKKWNIYFTHKYKSGMLGADNSKKMDFQLDIQSFDLYKVFGELDQYELMAAFNGFDTAIFKNDFWPPIPDGYAYRDFRIGYFLPTIIASGLTDKDITKTADGKKYFLRDDVDHQVLEELYRKSKELLQNYQKTHHWETPIETPAETPAENPIAAGSRANFTPTGKYTYTQGTSSANVDYATAVLKKYDPRNVDNPLVKDTLEKLLQRIPGPMQSQNIDLEEIMKRTFEKWKIRGFLNKAQKKKVTFLLENAIGVELLNTILPANGLNWVILHNGLICIGSDEDITKIKEEVGFYGLYDPQDISVIDVNTQKQINEQNKENPVVRNIRQILDKKMNGAFEAFDVDFKQVIPMLYNETALSFIIPDSINKKITVSMDKPRIKEALAASLMSANVDMAITGDGSIYFNETDKIAKSKYKFIYYGIPGVETSTNVPNKNITEMSELNDTDAISRIKKILDERIPGEFNWVKEDWKRILGLVAYDGKIRFFLGRE